MKGTLKTSVLSWESILMKTNNGYDIFRWELGNFPLNKCFNSPLRMDKNPSFSIFCKSGIWWYRDVSNGESGTALQFIQKYKNMDYLEALSYLSGNYGENNKDVIISWKAPKIKESETIISFSYSKWKKHHHEFWKNTPVDEDHCRKYDVYAVKDASINREKVVIGREEPVFAYYAADIDRVKLYYPQREKGQKFKSNVTGSYMFYLNMYEHCDNLVVAKSNKDSLIFSALGICSTATLSESMAHITRNREELERISRDITINFGSDQQGREESIKITNEYGYKWFNTPNEDLEKGINDPYAYCKEYGWCKFSELLKSKNLL